MVTVGQSSVNGWIEVWFGGTRESSIPCTNHGQRVIHAGLAHYSLMPVHVVLLFQHLYCIGQTKKYKVERETL